MGEFYSLNNLDKKMLKYINYQNGFYIEIGANDGILQSNTLYLEKNLNWIGILIEPTNINFKKLIANRKKTNFFEMAACVSFSHKNNEVTMVYSNLMSTVLDPRNNISDPLLHAQKGKKFLNKEDIYTVKVKAKPLNDILNKYKAPRQIDFFSLDVEGFELEVLKGVDHTQYRFKYILIETRKFNELRGFLEDKKYRLVDQLSNHDYLFTDELNN